MQDFLGFIDYSRTEPIIDINDYNIEIYQEKYALFNIFLSYNIGINATHLNNKNIFITLFGTINNQSKLRRLLHRDNSISDIELMAESYKRWGLEFIKIIEGSFAIILYDKNREILVLLKDKIGKIPINYYESDNKIIFTSSVQRFKEVSTFVHSINPQSLASYLQFGAILQPNTILTNCYKVKAGEYIEFNLLKKESKEHRYWRLEECYSNPKRDELETSIINNAHQLLRESVDKSYLTDKRVALSLSGGYDSSTLASILQEQREIDTFTIGFNQESINEAKEAKAIAKHLGTKHHEYYFRAKDALEIIPKLSQIYDEPFAEYGATPTLLTAQLISQEGIDDIVVGDGGDEVFATADDVSFFHRIDTIPQHRRERLCSLLKRIPINKIPYLEKKYNLPTKCSKIFNIISSKNIPKMVEAKNILFREDELHLIIQNYTNPILTTFDDINFDGHHETVDEIIGTYFKTTMTDGELVKSYRAMNNYNISLHTPFLDEQLISYMATIPSSIKIKDGIKKYILKEIAHQYIPKALLDRPKRGFDIPFSSWMRNELKELVYSQINEKRLNEDKIFYTSFIINIRDSFYQGNDSYKYKLWRLFLFQLWYENFKG